MIITSTEYIIMKKQNLSFLNIDGETTDCIEEASIFGFIDDAQYQISICDYPEEFEIRELKTSYNIGKVIK